MYVKVKSVNPLVIEKGPMPLPKNYKNISGFNKLDEASLKKEGFYRYVADEVPTHCSDTEEIKWSLVVSEGLIQNRAAVLPLKKSVIESRKTKAKKELLNTLADYRWKQETAGVIYEDHLYSSQRDGDMTLYVAAQGSHTKLWKTKLGDWIELSPEQLRELLEAITEHRNNCFKKEAEISKAIKALESFKSIRSFSIEEAWNA